MSTFIACVRWHICNLPTNGRICWQPARKKNARYCRASESQPPATRVRANTGRSRTKHVTSQKGNQRSRRNVRAPLLPTRSTQPPQRHPPEPEGWLVGILLTCHPCLARPSVSLFFVSTRLASVLRQVHEGQVLAAPPVDQGQGAGAARHGRAPRRRHPRRGERKRGSCVHERGLDSNPIARNKRCVSSRRASMHHYL